VTRPFALLAPLDDDDDDASARRFAKALSTVVELAIHVAVAPDRLVRSSTETTDGDNDAWVLALIPSTGSPFLAIARMH